MFKKVLSIAIIWSFALGSSDFEEATREFIVSVDYDKAIKLYEKSCIDGKNAVGCYAAAFLHTGEYSKLSSVSKGRELYIKSCDMGDMDGCKAVGDLYDIGGEKFERNSEKAIEFYTKACNAKIGSACTKLGDYYDIGRESVEVDILKAAEFYKMGCEYKDANACYSIASIYEFGNGVETDKDIAMDFYGLACDYGAFDACAIFRKLFKLKK